jgi:hypothetical protein
MGSHPRYPGSISECPKLLLRDYKGNNKSRPNGGLTFDWQMSLWYYRAQTPGQEHQELLLADMVLIENLWLGNYNPEPVKAAGCSFVMPIQTVNHNELEHRSGRADFRVSVAEILLGYQSQIS